MARECHQNGNSVTKMVADAHSSQSVSASRESELGHRALTEGKAGDDADLRHVAPCTVESSVKLLTNSPAPHLRLGCGERLYKIAQTKTVPPRAPGVWA